MMSGSVGARPAGSEPLRQSATDGRPPTTDTPAVAAIKLSKAYGARRVLRTLNLTLAPGERLAVVGPNGAGKSTLIRLLSMLTRPTAGKIEICGLDGASEAQEIRRMLGVVLHDSLLYSDLTVFENLAFVARLYSVSDVRQRLLDVMDRLDLEPLAATRIRHLSRGQRQRTSIARALIHDPPILLLDEPDTGLDAGYFERVAAELTGVRAKTLIFTTHHAGHAVELATRILLLEGGRASDLGDARRWTSGELTALLVEAGSGPVPEP